jgi:hypothetical protein
MIGRGWAVAIALGVFAGAYGTGWYHGHRQAGIEAQARLAQAMQQAVRNAQMAGRIEAERLALEAERDALAQELEDQANADTDSTGGLSRGRVDRLRQR